ncbi:MAG: DUF4340 domain-containing protein [Proteobacteria bacterium]|nr:DUF4340 domain-containing protein [Pseudomonadota bacterium]
MSSSGGAGANIDMNKRWLTNLILLGAIALMALVLTTQPGKQSEEKHTLTALKQNDIQRIELLRPTKEKLVLEKRDKLWHMSSPMNARSNRFTVSSLLKLASTETGLRFAADDSALKQYGLDKPAATLLLNDTTLLVGNKHPIKHERYVKAGNWITLIPVNRLRMSESPYTDFISSALIEENKQLVGLNLGQQQLAYKDGKWSLTPANKDITADSINQFVNEWRLAHALSVDRYSKKPVKQWLSVSTRKTKTDNTEAAQTIKLGIVSYKPEFVLYRPDENLEYRFSEDASSRMLQLKPADKKND